ncbi:MAG TPA: hypothetical protein DGT23_00395 [Micromonosporaceae bacterium]|nr:hypothetical protein [Micromonosporaceae bacterium]
MRVVRLAGAPAVVRIRRRDEVTILLPAQIREDRLLTMAGLVLTCDELDELERTMTPAAMPKSP